MTTEILQPEIKNRRELFDYLGDQMNSTYQQVLTNKRVEKESNSLKTYLLEFDWQPSSIIGSESEFLTKALTISPNRSQTETISPIVQESEENGFYKLRWQFNTNAELYLDTSSDPLRRFWIGYSISDAASIDGVIEKLTYQQPAFDRAWLWPNILQETQSLGEFRGIGLEYDYRRFDLTRKNSDSTEYLKLQLYGGEETKEIIDFIKGNPALSRRMVVSKIRMRYFENNPNNFAIEEIKYNGKFRTNGSSFSVHQSLVNNLRLQYSTLIRAIEERYVGSTFAGFNHKDPVFFRFAGESKIQDIDSFCKIVFSGFQPFRLWGVPEMTGSRNSGRKIHAVDLHTGSRLYFEIYEDIICLGLQEGAYGNTVARFFTNLQQSFSHEIVAQDGNGTDIFQLAIT